MLPLLSFALVALLAGPQQPDDPESKAQGRTHYLGREIAQTMHWTGASWLLRATREDEEQGVVLRKWLAVQPGQAVCDLGCGNGYHTLPLAEAVGGAGKVFAVELQPQMLVLLRQRSEKQHLANIAFVECTVDDPKLPPASCDVVLLVDVYHELSHPVRVMDHVRKALKPDGRVVLVEFRAEDPDVPIKPEHKMTKAQIVREMATHGLRQVDAFDGLPWQHAMAFAAVATEPRLPAREVLRGFLAAAGRDDDREVRPYLAAGVAAADLPKLAKDHRVELRAGADGRLLAALALADGGRLAHGRDEVELVCDRDGRWAIAAVRAPKPFVRPHGNSRPFVAMHTGTGGGSVADQVALVDELGFDGIEWGLEHLGEVRAACEARGRDLVAAYAVLDLRLPVAESLLPLREALRTLAGGPGMLWLALRNDGEKPGAASGDAAAAAALAALLPDAAAAGVEVALYPHHGFWLETTEHAQRLCQQVGHAQLGLCFNLCHFLRTGDASDPAPLLARIAPHLLAVTVNGADVGGDDWPALIRPLGEGDFDLRGLLATLDKIGFSGPVALQGFGIARPAREHLASSMLAWRAAQRR